MSAEAAHWFRTLGAPLGAADHARAQGYLCGIGLAGLKVRLVRSWQDAGELCRRPAGAWWSVEAEERQRLERAVGRNVAGLRLLDLGDRMQRAALAHAAGAGPEHVFAQKQALFRAGRWPLGVYDEALAIF